VKVFDNQPTLTPETEAHICQAIEELNYTQRQRPQPAHLPHEG
jgi:DNA-binding LacI/PurR family transcriptional regulator